MSEPSTQKKGMSEARGDFRVIWPDGLSVRVSHAIVTLVQSSGSSFNIEFEGRTVNGDSILELLSLSALTGSEFKAIALGENASDDMSRFLNELPSMYFEVIR